MALLTGAALAQRLAPPPRWALPSFVPDMEQPVDNSAAPVPPPPPRRPASVVLNTLRCPHAPDPSGLPPGGFTASVAPELASSARLVSALLWPCDGPSDAEPVAALGAAAHGHQGLAWYVYTCWAQERGCVLRPDLVWVAVASEFARDSVAAPKAYRPLFTSATDGTKRTLRLMVSRDDEQMPLGQLAQMLEASLSDRRIAELVAHSDFASAGPGYRQAAASALAAAASPFYNYETIDGGSDEWQRLAGMCRELGDHVAACDTPRTTQFAEYCRDVAGLVCEIDAYAHCDMSVRANAEAAQTFFSACFWITANCGSGHPYFCCGWLSRLYFAQPGSGNQNDDGRARVDPQLRSFDSVLDFPRHSGLVAWRNVESKRMFCSCTGLFYSTLSADGAFLLPCYGQLQYEITDEGLFKQLALM
eukprot:m51a1_g335 hypothetical protein (419) ;mRNA; r:500772-502163